MEQPTVPKSKTIIKLKKQYKKTIIPLETIDGKIPGNVTVVKVFILEAPARIATEYLSSERFFQLSETVPITTGKL